MQLTKTTLLFDLRLRRGQVRQFRGAIDDKINQAVGDYDLFHNHDNSEGRLPGKYLNRYPLVQYQEELNSKRATLVGVQQGAQALLDTFLDNFDGELLMDGNVRTLHVEAFQHEAVDLAVLPEMKHYRLQQWIPLRSKHLAEWNADDRLSTRIPLLEKRLISHILGFASGVNWQIPERFDLYLTDYAKGRKQHHRGGAVYLTFDVDFKCNLELPDGIGLGMGASEGKGRLSALKK
jgi:hypothetical protein